MSTISIRKASIGDADALFGFARALATSYIVERGAFERALSRITDSDSSLLFVAESGSRIAGYALASIVPTFYANGMLVELVELYVDEQMRGLGIGSALMSDIEAEARRIGAVEITVMTRRARDFYLKSGFEETAIYYKRKL
jgi:N-acetylglutamate synthase-like GNAT family acetyltransferase